MMIIDGKKEAEILRQEIKKEIDEGRYPSRVKTKGVLRET